MSAYSDRVIADGAVGYWRLGYASVLSAAQVANHYALALSAQIPSRLRGIV